MTILSELKKAIHELQLEKNEILAQIQEHGWAIDPHVKRIPERLEIDYLLEDLQVSQVVPEKRLLPSEINRIYQQWYSGGHAILEKNQPSRIREFEEAYQPSGKNPAPGIKHLLSKRHVSKDEQLRLIDIINSQFDILIAVPSHLKYSIYDIELTAYSVLMDDEISAAQHLLKKGFLRPAGALAGVILERHLKNLLRKHTPPIKYKEKDTLSPLNDLCKETVYKLITWRKIQTLTDLRNLCDHDNDDREPTKDEVEELIDGVAKILKKQNQL